MLAGILAAAPFGVRPEGTAAAAASWQVPAEVDPYQPYEPQMVCRPEPQPGVWDFATLLLQMYPQSGWAGISRACHVGGRSEHKEGRAFDWAVSATNAQQRAAAEEALGWLLATDEHGNEHALFRRFGLMYIIWNRQIFRSYRAAEGWQPYPCDESARHDDCHVRHVHFSFSWAGAQARTSWWTAAPSSAPVPANGVPARVERIAGPLLIDTAVEVSKRAFPVNGSAEYVFVADAKSPHDGMVAAVMAGAFNGSLLLTNGVSTIEPQVDAEIERLLGAEPGARLVFVGGPAVLPEAIAAPYRQRYEVKRIFGEDLFATARAGAAFVEEHSGRKTAVVVSAAAYHRGLPMIAVAAANEWPVLFTTSNRLHPEARRVLVEHGIQQVHLVAERADVSDSVAAEIDALPGIAIERHHGRDRYETSVAVAERFFPQPSGYALATGRHWADAIVGAYYAGKHGHVPLLLTDKAELPAVISDYLNNTHQPGVDGIIVGGPAVVRPSVEAQLRDRLR